MLVLLVVAGACCTILYCINGDPPLDAGLVIAFGGMPNCEEMPAVSPPVVPALLEVLEGVGIPTVALSLSRGGPAEEGRDDIVAPKELF